VTRRRRHITCSVRGGRSCPLEHYLHQIWPDQPASQETRIRPPSKEAITAGQRDKGINPSKCRQKLGRASPTEHGQVRPSLQTQRDALSRSGRTQTSSKHGTFHGNLNGKVSNWHETLLQLIRRSSSAGPSSKLYNTCSAYFCGRFKFTTLRSLRLLHPFPTHMLSLHPPPRLIVPVTLPPTHHTWFSFTGPGP
jgi:hypothetical protein